MVGSAISKERVGPFCYVRFHGTSGRYHGSYDEATLNRWAHRLAMWWHAGSDIYVYFNNDPDAVATQNAQTLRRALSQLVRAPQRGGNSSS
jgi:uncharacterized protein YecE (DUF72 family)